MSNGKVDIADALMNLGEPTEVSGDSLMTKAEFDKLVEQVKKARPIKPVLTADMMRLMFDDEQTGDK